MCVFWWFKCIELFFFSTRCSLLCCDLFFSFNCINVYYYACILQQHEDGRCVLCVFYFFFHKREHIWRFIIIIENTYATERALCIRYLLWSVITHHIQLWWKWTDMISYAVGELHFINYKLLCFSCAHTQSHPPFLFCFIWIEAFVP